jgi:hypothetical protein
MIAPAGNLSGVGLLCGTVAPTGGPSLEIISLPTLHICCLT